MNMRDTVFALIALSASGPITSFAQQPAKVFRIGFLGQALAAALASVLTHCGQAYASLATSRVGILSLRSAGRRNTSNFPAWQQSWFVSR